MNDFIWTKSENDFKDWDKFLSSTKRGHYLQISHWLKSHETYGFDTELLLIKDEKSDIVAGAGLIICKFFIFKFCVVNCGPIIKEGYENLFSTIIEEILSRSRKYKPIAISINLPILDNSNSDNVNVYPFCLDVKLNEEVLKVQKQGILSILYHALMDFVKYRYIMVMKLILKNLCFILLQKILNAM